MSKDMGLVKKKKDPKKNAPRIGKYEAEKHLRDFCNATSHELNNVLGTVAGELDYALSITQPKARERAMSISLSAAQRALELARNLRYFAIHTRLNFKTLDLSQILLDAVDLVEQEFEARNIRVNVFAEANCFVQIDSGAIQQIILNLLYNAATAMPGGGKITLSLRQSGDHLEVRCSDLGIGISEERVEEIFDPYFSLQSETGPGSQGLGLAVSKALVEAHGGEIYVQSQKASGTTFTLIFPFDPSIQKPNHYETKRRHRRVKLSLKALVTLSKHINIEGEIQILSNGGCFVHLLDTSSIRLPEKDDELSLSIFHFEKETTEIPKARVADVCWAGPKPGVGLEFLDLGEKARKLIHALVHSHAD